MKDQFLRDVLVRLADKWTLAVVKCLAMNGEMRFTRLQNSIGGVSQKMLTKTLRQLERDGFVTRSVHARIPPRVDYKLTPLGQGFLESIAGVSSWVSQNTQRVELARRDFDTPGVSRDSAALRQPERKPPMAAADLDNKGDSRNRADTTRPARV
jgi:DNA-binding HxlR family transcriptional regulator